MRPICSSMLYAGIALSSLVAATPAFSAEKINWAWTWYGPPRALTASTEYVAKYVAEKSGGNFNIKIHYAEELSPAKSVLDGLKIDAFQGAATTYSYAPGKTPLHTILDLPYLPIPDVDAQAKVWDVFVNWEPARKELARWNAYALLNITIPQYEFMGAGKAPKSFDDWKGMRVRALGPLGDAMKTLGAVPTSVPAPEVYNGLERGTFQAASFGFSYAFGTYKLHEVSKWYTNGLQLGAVASSLSVSLAAYKALPAEYKKMLEDARAGAYAAQREAFAAEDRKWVPIFEKAGLEKLVYTADDLKPFQEKAAKPVWDKWIAENKAKGLPAQEAFDLVMAEAKKAQASK